MTGFGLLDLWKVSGILLASQFGYVLWRVKRELRFRASGQPTWLPPADYLNLLAMLTLVVGVFALPAIGKVPERFAWTAFGLALLSAIGFCFSLLGHYQLFGPKLTDVHYHFPREEKIAVFATILVLLGYVAGWIVGLL
jgi:hypothetical protein